MKYQLHTLHNGLRIVFAPMPGTATATVVVMTGTGSRYEGARENGLAHFLEHMLFKGTHKRPSARAISEELDGVGAVYNAFTSKERGAIIQEIDMYEDMPMRTIDNVFDALIFGTDHPLGRTILGPKENIRSFKRKEFDMYLKCNYTPANTVVCVAGAFSQAKVLAKIKRDFSRIKPSTPPEYMGFISEQSSPRIAIKKKQTDQTQLMLGVPAYPYLHKDEFALAVLATVLGGGRSSRLFLEVREKRGLKFVFVEVW